MHHDYQQLSKSDKKVVRALIDMGIAAEFKKGMEDLDLIMQKWRAEGANDQQHYADLYGAIRNFDKYIARRYDGLTGSRYIIMLIYIFVDDILPLSDLDGLSEEYRNTVISTIKGLKK